MKTHSPYGSWLSPISAELVAGKTPKINEPCIDSGRIFWLQSIPEEQGRMTIMMRDGGGGSEGQNQVQSLLPRPLSAKSRVHEYGGGSFCVNGDDIYFVLAEDQRVYKFGIHDEVFNPIPLTPERASNDGEGKLRFADLSLDLTRQRLLAVCESHGANEHNVENSLVAIPLDGRCELTTLASGEDFYSNPKVSPDGNYMCWLNWCNPDMPWDATQLWCAIIGEKLTAVRRVAGDGKESIFQPSWSPRGDLIYVSDRNNWWNLYLVDGQSFTTDVAEPLTLCAMDAEFATPQWTFNMRTYGFVGECRILATATDKGQWGLFDIDYSDQDNIGVTPISTSSTEIYGVYGGCNNGLNVAKSVEGEACFIGASPVSGSAVWCFREGLVSPLEKLSAPVAESEISIGESFDYPTTEGQRAWGFFYAPTNSAYEGKGNSESEDERPPLIVLCHGGPTGATGSSLNFKIQYWTNRGFAVVDVNYRGSTGFGRTFRRQLYQNWGVHDVDDVCAAARYVCDNGWADAQRCIIKGSSAGGYTVLAALAFRDTFQLGTSLYGIGDLTLLAEDTHKFEARYLDQLIGSYPEDKALYEQRSPLNYVEQITCPLLVFQGLKDKVVPPNQAQQMVDAVKAQGQAVAYTTYKNEAHGFQRSETVQHMLAVELYFYAQIFNFPVDVGLSESSLAGRAGDESVTQFHHMPNR
ncbi:MAG: S9 family peptidase [Alteromonadaceae bacterium]|nr:MAG: S9 family peptidase [Alteromonadaceae bacterium]